MRRPYRVFRPATMVYPRPMMSPSDPSQQGVYRMAADLAPPPPRTPSQQARQIIFAYQGSQRITLIIGLVFMGIGLVVGLVFGAGAFADIALDIAATPC